MFDPVRELVVAAIALVATSLWWYFDPSAESRAALGIAIAGTVGAGIHLAYQLGTEAVPEQERNDRYAKRKVTLQKAKERLAREKSNLDRLAKDPASAAGDTYTERTPFELMIKELYPLREFKGYGKLIDGIVQECNRILELPSGKRDVTKLMKDVKKLDRKLASVLQEEPVWR